MSTATAAVTAANDLKTRLAAAFPLLSMITPEESRALLMLARIATETKRALFVWSITKGLERFADDGSFTNVLEGGAPQAVAAVLSGSAAPMAGVKNAIVAILDFEPYFRDPVTVRALRDSIPLAKSKGITGVFLGPKLELPVDLQREVASVDLHLPDSEELSLLVQVTYEANSKKKGLEQPKGLELARLVDSARGLTVDEAENAFALSIVRAGQFSHEIVAAEKARAVKTSGALEILAAPAGGLENVGGLTAVKDWIRTRGKAFSPEAKAYGLPNPKGLLAIGVQGCGKSLICRAAAAALGLPLVRLNVGALFGSLVGQSEANVRQALKTIDAIAPCVVMVDELEKAFAGTAAGKSTDSGTGSRVLGEFLTWTQERESPVFVMATANDVSALPPELLRRGRWDTMMFVDLPTAEERADILKIHLAKRKRSSKGMDLEVLAQAAEGFSGAELEQCITDALFEAFADDAREIKHGDVLAAVKGTVPLSRTMAAQVGSLREWAASRCVPASGRVVAAENKPRGRAVSH
jgi:ATP-dependent 26S proteasome regulatory subunit